MTLNSDTDADQQDILDMVNTLLLRATSEQTSAEPTETNQPDVTDKINHILLRSAYGPIPAKAAAAVPGLEIFEDSDNPGSWFWEWGWGECQDGPYSNELEALIAFAQYSSGLAIELGGEEEE
ncbi:MAG: hypothetical protein AAFR24_11635 [Cyanobacteria bacterium J06627_3]